MRTAENDFSTLLPEDQLSDGHDYYTIENEAEQSVGAIWVARSTQ
jgi:hypothetical protein